MCGWRSGATSRSRSAISLRDPTGLLGGRRAVGTGRSGLAALTAVAAGGLLLSACVGGSIRDGREAALEAELRALEDYLRPEAAPPSAFQDVLLVVREPLVEGLIRSVLPLEATVEGLLLRVDSAEVDFRPGLAVVRLDTRVSPARASGVSAQVNLLGSFEIRPFPEEGQRLTARVRLFGLDTRDVRLGALSPPAERLVNELARSRAEELNALLDSIEIPVRLVEVIELPAVEEDQVTIPAARLSVRFELASVRVLEEGILISLRVDRAWTDVARWSAGGFEEWEEGRP